MSYDIDLTDPVTGETLQADSPHQIKGGNYIVGGTPLMTLSVTYNYYSHFQRAFGNHAGIRSIFRKSGAESIPLLKNAISVLGDDVDQDYWKPTEGNAKQALYGLLAFAQMRPDGVWKGE